MSRVTVLMPCYNAEEFLQESIGSLLSQSMADFVLLIVDDGSTDCSADIIQSFAVQDQRIRYIRESNNKGIIFRRNQLLTLCDTPIACWADADDYYFPERLEKQLTFLDKNLDVGVCSCDFIRMKDGKEEYVSIDPARLSREFMLFYNALFNPGAMFRMEHVRKHRVGFSQEVSGASDYHFWCSLMPVTSFAQINLPLVKYRIHPGQESIANRSRQMKGHCEAVVKNLSVYGVDMSEHEVAILLIYPIESCGGKLSVRDHKQALATLHKLKNTLPVADNPNMEKVLLNIARAHCRRLGIGAIGNLFKLFGIRWLNYSRCYGAELTKKMLITSLYRSRQASEAIK
ncbi:glycosyltransferase [Bowmanella dokdonensis]|uniref:Glycosyltransferase family 2 protein n=1 Tax=Bowmanella dokdonensis TaxID=751969 RepID=A0A939DPD8_9ALTE|nr:glycosyltransferase family 2 protein [Bowmanella dokdonensis]